MKRSFDEEWDEDDATWKLLGRAAPGEVSGRFADDAVRAVRLLPESGGWFGKVSFFAPWVAVAGCGMLGALIFLGGDEVDGPVADAVVVETSEQDWEEMEQVADAEMLAAAADHLDEFSDQELVSLIGF